MIACNSNTTISSNDEKITREILTLNSISLEIVKQQVIVPEVILFKGDTILLDTNVLLQLFGKGSIHGKYLPVLANSKLAHAYTFRKSFAFDIYDSLGGFVDRGMLPKEVVMRLTHDDVDFGKTEFQDKLIEKREKNYDAVAKKYAVSRQKLSRLVQVELDKKQDANR